jgi:response regulator RpfG family c-di-GMP phosphodiesterase
MDETQQELIKLASPMHDIGKIAISDNILKKNGQLNNDESQIMKLHTKLGYEMLSYSNRPILQTAATIALEHHERWDGKGYPRGLKGKNIHIYGRITALADVFDALGSNRFYKKAWKDEDIFSYIQKEKGKHFDPELVDLFFENVDLFLQIKNKYHD